MVTSRQIRALRDASASTGRPVALLIREGVDRYLAGREERIDRAICIAGTFSSGRTDVSAHHDKHLAEALAR
ncbi:MAG TPA: hypothetical protein VGG72_10160 [Bryobacteraceae bacterium]